MESKEGKNPLIKPSLKGAKYGDIHSPSNNKSPGNLDKQSFQLSTTGDCHDNGSAMEVQVSDIKVYRRRWYILFLFSMLPSMENYLYNTWPVIADSIVPLFGWSLSEISLMQIWFNVMFFVAVVPMSWMMDVKGLRSPIVITAACQFSATVLRSISMSPPTVTWLNNIGNCLLGISVPVSWIAGPVISGLWFPPSERTISTSISMLLALLGYAVAFITGPLYVSMPDLASNVSSSHLEYTNLGVIKDQIRTMRLIECGVCGLMLLAILIYFPSKPPKPPSRSAALPKLNFIQSIKSLCRCTNMNFWLINLSYALSQGVYGAWFTLLVVNFGTFLPQFELGYIGCITNVFGCVAGIGIGKVSSRFSRKYKMFILVTIFGTLLSTFWLILLGENFITFSLAQMYIAIILQSIFINGPLGIYLELAVENNYPMPETVTSGAVQFSYNFLPVIFLMVFLIPNVGTLWMNWFMFSTLFVNFFLMLFFKENYNRLDVDLNRGSLW